MQFGRFHGIALLALGALLLLLQTFVSFRQKAPPGDGAPSAQQAPVSPGWDYLPGVLGIVLAGAGAYALARTEEARRHEDRSLGGRGHHVSTPTIWKER